MDLIINLLPWLILGILGLVTILFFLFQKEKKITKKEILPPQEKVIIAAKQPVELREKRVETIPTATPQEAPVATKTPLTAEAPVTREAPVVLPVPEAVPPVEVAPPPLNWRQRLILGLKKTHNQIFKSLDEFFLKEEVKLTREQTLEKLFEILIQADVGVNTSELLVKRVKERLDASASGQADVIRDYLKEEILALLKGNVSANTNPTIEAPQDKPHVVLMVGVNGVGKTTTTGKLAYKASQKQQKVVVGAADTFRAAAVEQLKVWAERSNALFIRLKEGSDPASVAFEAVKQARTAQADLCIIDTAGRLHNRQDLMQELAKIKRVMGKEDPKAPHEVLLVLDATTGQNAIQQAKIFGEIVNISGLVITKLDGTAKGGVAIAVVNELKIPIRYIGVGETVEDIEPFDAEEFVNALFAD